MSSLAGYWTYDLSTVSHMPPALRSIWSAPLHVHNSCQGNGRSLQALGYPSKHGAVQVRPLHRTHGAQRTSQTSSMVSELIIPHSSPYELQRHSETTDPLAYLIDAHQSQVQGAVATQVFEDLQTVGNTGWCQVDISGRRHWWLQVRSASADQRLWDGQEGGWVVAFTH